MSGQTQQQDLATMPVSDLLNLDEDQLDALMGIEADADEAAPQGQETQAGEESETTDQGQQGDNSGDQAPPSAGDQSTTPPTGRPPEGYVPLGAVHEERGKRQQLQEQLQGVQSFLQNPQAILQYAAQLHGLTPEQIMALKNAPQGAQSGQMGQQQQAQDPDAFFDDPNGFLQPLLADAIKQAIAPYEQSLQQLRGIAQEAQASKRITEVTSDLREKLGAEFADSVPEYLAFFDQQRPDMANVDPGLKVDWVLAQIWKDPDFRKQYLEAQAKALAAEKVAESLGGNKRETPVTLAGLTPAAQNQARPNLREMSAKDMLNMSEDELDRLYLEQE